MVIQCVQHVRTMQNLELPFNLHASRHEEIDIGVLGSEGARNQFPKGPKDHICHILSNRMLGCASQQVAHYMLQPHV